MATTRAAQYLRMSTEHQRYSPEHQAAAIQEYALRRGYGVVKTYRDDGISGLTIRKREGLKTLIGDVVAGRSDFEVILVYDVSRWGRFQNPDQSAHYEFLCSEAGVRVEYCAEPFDNDGTPASTIVKAVKRVMAAEYSRELSAKVAAAQRRLAAKGYWQGGAPGYGYRRQMLDGEDRPVGLLAAGEYKGVASYRTVLVLGPELEQTIVRRIYRAFVAGAAQSEIAKLLNSEGVSADGGGLWTYMRIDQMLKNSKYTGILAAQRTTSGALRPRRVRPANEWVVAACPAVVDRALFNAAQARLKSLKVCPRRSYDELLEVLRRIQSEHGQVTQALLDATPGAPCHKVYQRRFGSFAAAKELLNLSSDRRLRPRRRWSDPQEALVCLAKLLVENGRLTTAIVCAAPDVPHPLTLAKMFGSLLHAYALVGYLPVRQAARSTQVGQARQAAADLRLERILRIDRADGEAISARPVQSSVLEAGG